MASSKVKVFNDNDYPFKSIFKGDPVLIKAKDYWRNEAGEPLVLDLFEANDFRGQYHPIKKLASGLQDPETYKMIKLEDTESKAASAPEMHTCQKCAHKSPSMEELQAHITVRHADAPRTEIGDLDETIGKKGKKTA